VSTDGVDSPAFESCRCRRSQRADHQPQHGTRGGGTQVKHVRHGTPCWLRTDRWHVQCNTGSVHTLAMQLASGGAMLRSRMELKRPEKLPFHATSQAVGVGMAFELDGGPGFHQGACHHRLRGPPRRFGVVCTRAGSDVVQRHWECPVSVIGLINTNYVTPGKALPTRFSYDTGVTVCTPLGQQDARRGDGDGNLLCSGVRGPAIWSSRSGPAACDHHNDALLCVQHARMVQRHRDSAVHGWVWIAWKSCYHTRLSVDRISGYVGMTISGLWLPGACIAP
jgi:hypothetical protein